MTDPIRENKKRLRTEALARRDALDPQWRIEASLEMGLRVFDAAVGGLGGCPYAPGAAGNVATEAVQERLTALGYETGLDRDVLVAAAKMAQAMRSDR